MVGSEASDASIPGAGDLNAGHITRRDFVGATLVGAGAALVPGSIALGMEAATAPEVGPAIDPVAETRFNGPPGRGDYAPSNGNTWRVLTSAHQIRDGWYDEPTLGGAADTEETLDLIVVGGGPAGLAAAYYFLKKMGSRGRALILDNHPVFGGEAKQNEFIVEGERLIAPQGSNLLYTPRVKGPVIGDDHYLGEELDDLDVPRTFEYATCRGASTTLQFDRTNYQFMSDQDHSESVGLFFDDGSFGHGRTWINNPYARELRGSGAPERLRAELIRWRHGLTLDRPPGPDLDRWLDGQTYRTLLMETHGLPKAVSDYVEPIIASAVGFGSSAVSAYVATIKLDLPGAAAPGERVDYPDLDETRFFDGKMEVNSFPGGNSGLARAFLKRLVPDAIAGATSFDDIVTRPIVFDALDRRDQPIRVRCAATVVDVRHVAGDRVRVTYEQGGRLYSSKAKAVVMANGGWISKHVVRDMPDGIRQAYDSFRYEPMLVANVALTNWRFLDKLGLTSCLYTGGEFGFACNIRRPMHLAGYRPPLDPNKPVVLTFYAPTCYPDESADVQGGRARAEIFGTSFAEFEGRIRRQMTRLFGDAGFDDRRDIAGLILNRWGHAYVNPGPGFMFGLHGKPSNSDVVRGGFDRIAFAAAELRGLQNFRGAVYESRRAVGQLSSFFS